jgi:hypothetical protein
MSAEDILKQYEDIALSDKELLKIIDGKANLILYPQLINFRNIDEMLDPYGACIILFEAKPHYGHWCCLFKISHTMIEFFNPYGGWPDDSLEYIPMEFRKQSNQDKPYLSELMINSPYELSYNEHAFQKHGKNIKTCGRWCGVRLALRYMSLEEFAEFIKKMTKLLKINGDELVTLLTMYVNK